MNLLRRLWAWLRPKMPVVNIGLAVAAYVANGFFFQVFCQPVRWAAIVLVTCTGAFLAWPWLDKFPVRWRYVALFLQGGMLPICLYCMWFFGGETYVGSLFFAFAFWLLLAPVLVWVPVVFALQLVRRVWTTQLPNAVAVFGLGALLPLLAQGWAEYQFREVEVAVAQLPLAQRQDIAALAAVVPHTYMAERLAGTQFKYHNYFCVYDGLRPPLHDPLVNVCLWLRGGSNIMKWEQRPTFSVNPLYLIHSDTTTSNLPAPLTYSEVSAYQQVQLNHQATLYHQLFPSLPVQADCACTVGSGIILVQSNHVVSRHLPREGYRSKLRPQ